MQKCRQIQMVEKYIPATVSKRSLDNNPWEIKYLKTIGQLIKNELCRSECAVSHVVPQRS